jgi:hypothetical protein
MQYHYWSQMITNKQGGAWCNTTEDCSDRNRVWGDTQQQALTKSLYVNKDASFMDPPIIMPVSESTNQIGPTFWCFSCLLNGFCTNSMGAWSDFYNWNKVDIRYCDGGSFAGDAEGKDRVNILLWILNFWFEPPIIITQTDGVTPLM